MNIEGASRLLSRSRHALLRRARFECTSVGGISDERRQRLYELSDSMSREKNYESWERHLMTNDELHVVSLPSLDEGTHERGFQLWKYVNCTDTQTSVLFGGKLRIGQELRGMGLSILMNLVAANTMLERTTNSPGVDPSHTAEHKSYRVGLVNVHGLSALVPALESYQIAPLDIRWRPPLVSRGSESAAVSGRPSRQLEEMDFDEMHRRVTPMLHKMVSQNGFSFSGAFEGRVNVGQRSLSDPVEFPDRWWSRPGVRTFRRVVRRGSRDGNSRLYADTPEELILSREDTFSRELDAFIVFELNDENLSSMRHYVETKIS